VIELQQPLTESMDEIHHAIVQCMNTTLSELKRSNTTVQQIPTFDYSDADDNRDSLNWMTSTLKMHTSAPLNQLSGGILIPYGTKLDQRLNS
jgi:hypothetical protein